MDWILLMPVLIPVIGALSLIAMRFYFPKQSVLDGTSRFKRASERSVSHLRLL